MPSCTMSKDFPLRTLTLTALVVLATTAGLSVLVTANVSPSERHVSTASIDAESVAEENISITFPDDPLVLRSTDEQTIHIETNAEAGTSLYIDVESDTQLWTRSTEVSEDGTAEATFNLSDVEQGTELDIIVDSSGSNAQTSALVVNETATVNRTDTLSAVNSASNYTISGETDLFPGTEIEVRLTDSESSFSASDTVTVQEEDALFGAGVFSANFDLSSAPEDAELSVTVAGVPRSIDIPFIVAEDGNQTVFAYSETPANVTFLDSDETLLVEDESSSPPREETLVVHADSEWTIRGETNLQPGTELSVNAESESNIPNSFDVSESVTVREDGTFAVSMDVDEGSFGTEMSIEIVHPHGPPLEHVTGRIVNQTVFEEKMSEETTAEPTTSTRTTTTQLTTYDESGFWDTTTTTTSTETPTTDSQSDETGVPGFGVPVTLVGLLTAFWLTRR